MKTMLLGLFFLAGCVGCYSMPPLQPPQPPPPASQPAGEGELDWYSPFLLNTPSVRAYRQETGDRFSCLIEEEEKDCIYVSVGQLDLDFFHTVLHLKILRNGTVYVFDDNLEGDGWRLDRAEDVDKELFPNWGKTHKPAPDGGGGIRDQRIDP